MNEFFQHKNECCGCAACIDLCIGGAVSMHSDDEGFLYPAIDDQLCLHCKVCKAACNFAAPATVMQSNPPAKVYAVKHKNDAVRMSSSSGGVFTALSDAMLHEGGVVYGVVMSEKNCIEHSRATTKEERDKMVGSKYVQSDINGIYRRVMEDLSCKRKVLFTGTPCQVAALNKIVGKDNPFLTTIDFVCHGVSSPVMWQEHIKQLEKKRHKHIKAYSFRFKENGWHNFTEMATYSDDTCEHSSPLVQVLRTLFAKDLTLRPSCYQCKYACSSRISDITIGDFWGIERIDADFNDEVGVSLVMVNTEHGRELYHSISSGIDEKACCDDRYLQPSLCAPTAKPAIRDSFWTDYHTHEFAYVSKKYGGYSFKSRIKWLVKQTPFGKCLIKIKRKQNSGGNNGVSR